MSKTLRIYDNMPKFNALLCVNGKTYSHDSFKDKKILVVVFSCNHCPYVQEYEERMIHFQDSYSNKGVQLIAVNSNEIQHYPEDSFEKMVERAKKNNFNFLYLRDDDQLVATAFGATHTPQFFVFDENRKLRYGGKMDDNYQNSQAVKEYYLKDAVEAILEGREVKIPETFSIGCTIKWK